MRNIKFLVLVSLLCSNGLAIAQNTGSNPSSQTFCESGYETALTKLEAERSKLNDTEYASRLKNLKDGLAQCLGFCAPAPPLPSRPISPQPAASGCTGACQDAYGLLRLKVADLLAAYKSLKMVKPTDFEQLVQEFNELRTKVEQGGGGSPAAPVPSSLHIDSTGLTPEDLAKIQRINAGLDKLFKELEALRNWQKDHTNPDGSLKVTDYGPRIEALEKSGVGGSGVGPKGESVVAMQLTSGDPHCLNGGVQLSVGGTVTYVCNGANGLNGAPGQDGSGGNGSESRAVVGFSMAINLEVRDMKVISSYIPTFNVGGALVFDPLPIHLYLRGGVGFTDQGKLQLDIGPELLFQMPNKKARWLMIGVEGKFQLDVRPDFTTNQCPTATAWGIGGGPVVELQLGRGLFARLAADFMYVSIARCGEFPGQVAERVGIFSPIFTVAPGYHW